jgi:hypothetical protein
MTPVHTPAPGTAFSAGGGVGAWFFVFATNAGRVTGCDKYVRRLGAGVQFCTLKTEDDKLTHKLVLTSRKQGREVG